MDPFDFEELLAEILDITDEQRDKNDDIVSDAFYERFGIDYDQAYEFVKALLPHTPTVQAGLSGKIYNAFISKTRPIMLIKVEAQH